MANDRKIFPTEKILELVTGKSGSNTNDVASHILGRTLPSRDAAQAAAPYATAWLARWYPKFADMEWKEGENWEAFVKQVKARLGDNLSIAPMQGRIKELSNQALDALKSAHESLMRQTDAAVKLEEKVKSLEPLQALATALQKKNDELEAKLKAMKSEMGGLQRKVLEFQGKMPIDNDELMQTIKDAIKDGLKGVTIGTGAAVGAMAGEEAAAEPETTGEDDFGFGSSNRDSDGFGF